LNTAFVISKLAEFLGVIAVLLIVRLSQRLKYRPVAFKYPSREGIISLSLYGLILFLAAYYYGSDLYLNIDIFPGITPDLNQQFVLALVCLLLFVLALFIRRQPLLSAGWGRRQNFSNGLRLALVLVFLTIFLRGKIFTLINGISAEEGYSLIILLVISLAEESIFRGYIQLRLNSWAGNKNGLWLAALLFVIWQIPRMLVLTGNIWINFGLIAVQSLLLGWTMKQGGHVIAPALYRAVSDWMDVLK
jgi:membrane protease YdiL (CAAX protease family)